MKLNYFKTLFVAILVIFATTTNAETYSGTCGDNVNWSLDTETGLLRITGTGEMEDDLWLTHLSPWISYISSIKSVEIADGVTSIGFCAFSGCSGLTSVTIPNSVTYIGSSAFSGCTGLTSITIPNRVTSIGSGAFSGCSGLTSVTIPNSVIYIMERAFLGCTGLTSVTIGSGVSDIGEYAFNGCTGLTSITIPNRVTSIGDYTFDGCSGLTLVSIGSGVSDIGDYAFSGCTGLTSITIPNSVTYIGDYAFRNCSGLTSITIPNSVTSIGDYTFYGCSGLTLVSIGSGVSEIGKYAFSCRKLTGVYITDLKAWCNIDFGNSTYANPLFTAKKLYLNNELVTNLIIPEGVTTIKNYAFRNCSGLTSITIPNSVTSIGDYTFDGCSGLTEIYSLNPTPPVIKNNTFLNVPTTATLYVPASSKTAYQSTEYWSNFTNIQELASEGGEDKEEIFTYSGICGDNLNWSLDTETGLLKITGTGAMDNNYTWDSYYSIIKSVEIADGITSIGSMAFWNYSGITSVTIGNSVTSIGSGAFGSCSELTSVEVASDNANYTSIDGVLFNKDKTLIIIFPQRKKGEFIIPNSVTSIIGGTFSHCSDLTSITIPNSVTSIGDYAFEYCERLTSVTIPNSVTSIGYMAFFGSGLENVYITDLKAWCNIEFDNFFANPLCSDGKLYLNNELVTDLVIPEGVTVIKKFAFYRCSGLTSITIPNSVTSIGSGAFSGCSGLTSITIPNSVTSIESSTFAYCSGLTSVTIPNRVTSIENHAFGYCSGLTSVTIGSGVSEIGESAFYNCSKLNSIYSLTEYPPFIYSNTFNNVDKTIPVYIPKGTKEDYEFEWSDFTNFIESDFTGIEDSNIATSEIKVIAGNGIDICNYYGKLQVINLAGQVLKDTYVNGSAQITLPKGVYIVVTDNSSQKVVL